MFINSENIKTTDPLRLSLNLTDKANSKKSDKYVPSSNPIVFYTCKNKKNFIQ